MAGVVDDRAFGALEAEVKGLKADVADLRDKDVAELRAELRELILLIQQVKGGWKMLAGAMAFFGAGLGFALAIWKSLVTR